MKQSMYQTNDSYLQVTSYELPLAGLRQGVTLLQISDLHLMVTDENSTEAQKQHVEKQKQAWEPVRIDFARLYGDAYDGPHLLPTEEGLAHYVELIRTLRPDAVLFSGDMLEDYSQENLRRFASALERIDIPWMWVRGNHEQGHDEELSTYMQGGKPAQTLRVGNFKLVGLDNACKRITAEQTEAMLAEANETGCVPVLAMHIPALTEYNREETSCFNPYFLLGTGDVDGETAAFLAQIQKEDDPFAAILCGHVHGKHVSSYRPGRLQICTSSAMVGACSLFRFVPEER